MEIEETLDDKIREAFSPLGDFRIDFKDEFRWKGKLHLKEEYSDLLEFVDVKNTSGKDTIFNLTSDYMASDLVLYFDGNKGKGVLTKYVWPIGICLGLCRIPIDQRDELIEITMKANNKSREAALAELSDPKKTAQPISHATVISGIKEWVKRIITPLDPTSGTLKRIKVVQYTKVHKDTYTKSFQQKREVCD